MHHRHSLRLDYIQRWKIKWSWHGAFHHRLVMPTISYPRDKLCTPTERSDPLNGYMKEKVFVSSFVMISKFQQKKKKKLHSYFAHSFLYVVCVLILATKRKVKRTIRIK